MAIKLWLASLKTNVSNASGVQVPIQRGLGRNVSDTADASDVSGSDGMVTSDMTDTAGKVQAYQAQPSRALVCTGDTGDTYKIINTEAHAANELLLGDLLTVIPDELTEGFRQREPWLSGNEQFAARAYHAHHFNCHICTAAGRGNRYGRRCTVGLALWNTYLRD